MNNKRIPCTVEILTHNSGKTLRRALESVKDFAEIVIVDGDSTDETRALAEEYGAQIIQQDKRYLDETRHIKDFAQIRNQGLDECRQPWFLFLDSDEYCSLELVNAIRNISSHENTGAYWVMRKYVLNGSIVQCATTYPNRSMRFFAVKSVTRFIKMVHERIELRSNVAAGTIGAPVLVPLDTDLTKSHLKDAQYLAIEAVHLKALPILTRIRITLRTVAVSVRYLVRLAVILLACSGTRLPLAVELDRHRYNALYLKTLWTAWPKSSNQTAL